MGAGGAGSLLVEYLARLGVGRIMVADPDRLDITNLPRVVGATRWDARTWLTEMARPEWLRRIGKRLAARKVNVAAILARRAGSRTRLERIFGDVTDEHVAHRFGDCDYLFLAADPHQARLVFNALVHQYLVPGVQVGAKVVVDRDSGRLLDVFAVSRPVTPSGGCLWCNGFILPERLQAEAATPAERRAQRYVEDPNVRAPSVITLNAIAASQAASDFLFWLTGLAEPEASSDYVRFLPRRRDVRFDAPRRDPACPECGTRGISRLARGDGVSLPTRQ
ncbi:MAG: ThiF family adenylyltransferase [Chloroflexi bacterium]|nr:ThiF family adenylyltransferase [Chloroflexota bacterium]